MHRLCTATMPHRAYGLCAMVLTQVKAVGLVVVFDHFMLPPSALLWSSPLYAATISLVVVFTTLCGHHQPCCGLHHFMRPPSALLWSSTTLCQRHSSDEHSYGVGGDDNGSVPQGARCHCGVLIARGVSILRRCGL